jgi:hypothetical protein
MDHDAARVWLVGIAQDLEAFAEPIDQRRNMRRVSEHLQKSVATFQRRGRGSEPAFGHDCRAQSHLSTLRRHQR